jgi:hypothetical protein
LTAFIPGTKGEAWIRVFDKVFADRNPLDAFQQVTSKGGVPGINLEMHREFEPHVPRTAGSFLAS